MKVLYSDYFEIIKSFIYNTVPVLSGECAPSAIFELASVHSTQAIVSYVFMRYPELSDDKTREFMRRHCLNTIALYTRRGECMKALIEKLNAAGVDHLLMKGFIVRDYYTVPELRAYGDIDITIKKEDRKKCDELMRSLGYQTKVGYEPVYTYQKGAELYEIHTDIMTVRVTDRSDSEEYFRHLWDHARPYANDELPYTCVFTPEYHLIYLLTHIAKHICGSGAGVRMYLDIAFFIRNSGNELSWDIVKEELLKLSLTDFANTVFTAVEKWFGVKSPIALRPVEDEVFIDFTDYTMEGGTFGYNGRDKSIVFLKQQDRNDEKISKFRTILWHAFPPAEELEDRYAFLRKSRILLPAAWMRRFIDRRGEWGSYADRTKKIITADDEEVLKLKRIYKEIGL